MPLGLWITCSVEGNHLQIFCCVLKVGIPSLGVAGDIIALCIPETPRTRAPATSSSDYEVKEEQDIGSGPDSGSRPLPTFEQVTNTPVFLKKVLAI